VQLNDYEKKLKLISKDNKLNLILEDMKKENDQKITDFANKIEKIK
jgi:predicted DNA-binding protein YlxM (UPF0122 family)